MHGAANEKTAMLTVRDLVVLCCVAERVKAAPPPAGGETATYTTAHFVRDSLIHDGTTTLRLGQIHESFSALMAAKLLAQGAVDAAVVPLTRAGQTFLAAAWGGASQNTLQVVAQTMAPA